MENIHADAVMFHVVQAINPVINFRTGKIQKPDLVFDLEFLNLFSQLTQLMIEKDKVYHEALNEIEVINGLIDEELMVK